MKPLNIFLFFILGIASAEECSDLIHFHDKYWTLSKLYDGKVSSVSVDIKGKIYFVENKLPMILEGENRTIQISWGLEGKNITDLFADRRGSTYFTTEHKLYIVVDNFPNSLELCDIQDTIYLITADRTGMAYFLTDGKIGVNVLHQVGENPTLIEGLSEVCELLAVDSFRNMYFRNDKGSVVFYDRVRKYPVKGLMNVKTTSIAVDDEDNAYFATDDGCVHVLDVGGSEAVLVKGLNVPLISQIFVDKNGSIYIASMDDSKGGIYVLKD